MGGSSGYIGFKTNAFALLLYNIFNSIELLSVLML